MRQNQRLLGKKKKEKGVGEGQDALLTVRAVPISRGEGEGGVNKPEDQGWH